MIRKSYLILLFTLSMSMIATAQSLPSISPSLTAVDATGKEESGTSFTGSAPIEVHFYGGVEHADGWTAHYEWRFYHEDDLTEPYLVRNNEEETTFTFTEAGTHYVMLYATFTQGSDVQEYTEEYWATATPLTISASESKLEMPNAFSPNNDKRNDLYKPKDGYQSIVEFHGYIYNRWGQLLFEWTDPSTGWDGTHNGHPVKEGVYFCLVKARGADGRVFNIRRDVNLLRGFRENTSTAVTE